MIEFHKTVGLCCCILVPWTYVMSETAIEPPSQRREAFKVDGRPAFVIPTDKKTEGKTPWALYAPMLGKGLPGGAEDWMFNQFLDAGIAIAGVSFLGSHPNLGPHVEGAPQRIEVPRATGRGEVFARYPIWAGRRTQMGGYNRSGQLELFDRSKYAQWMKENSVEPAP